MKMNHNTFFSFVFLFFSLFVHFFFLNFCFLYTHFFSSELSNWLGQVSFPCPKWIFPINSHEGEGAKGLESLGRKKNEGIGRKKKKSEVEMLLNCNQGSFSTLIFLLVMYPVQQPISSSSFSFLFLRVECNPCTLMGPL